MMRRWGGGGAEALRDIAYHCCRCRLMYLLVSGALPLLRTSATTLQLVRFHYFCCALNLFTAEVAVAFTSSGTSDDSA